MTEPRLVAFETGKPFYDMVAAFLVGLSSSPALFNGDNPMGLTPDQYVSINGVLVQDKHLFPFDVMQQVHQGHIGMPVFLATSCMMLANTAYESVKHLNDRSPEFEFFRHIRNASSHGNRFTFSIREPKRPASWRGAAIDHSLKGSLNPLDQSPCFGPLFGPADLIDLLSDIAKSLDEALSLPPRAASLRR